MSVFADIDPGTTGLIAQFAAAGFAGVVVLFRSRFGRKRTASEETAPTADVDEAADDRG
jgi:hypothetical protein